MMKIIVLFVCFMCVPGIHADEVHLINGQVFIGEIISAPGDSELRIEVKVGTIVMLRVVQLVDIESVVIKGTTENERVSDLLKLRQTLGVSPDVGQMWKLVSRAEGMGESVMAKKYADEILELDPDHMRAHKFLRHVKFNGQWMTKYERHIAQDDVRFEGHWVHREKRDAIVEARLKQRENDRMQEQNLEHLKVEEQRLIAKKERAKEVELEELETSTGSTSGGLGRSERRPLRMWIPAVKTEEETPPSHCPSGR